MFKVIIRDQDGNETVVGEFDCEAAARGIEAGEVASHDETYKIALIEEDANGRETALSYRSGQRIAVLVAELDKDISKKSRSTKPTAKRSTKKSARPTEVIVYKAGPVQVIRSLPDQDFRVELEGVVLGYATSEAEAIDAAAKALRKRI